MAALARPWDVGRVSSSFRAERRGSSCTMMMMMMMMSTMKRDLLLGGLVQVVLWLLLPVRIVINQKQVAHG